VGIFEQHPRSVDVSAGSQGCCVVEQIVDVLPERARQATPFEAPTHRP